MTLRDALVSILPENRLLAEEPMFKHTTFRIGGAAEVLALPETADELINILRVCGETGAPFLIIGDGANMLVSDKGLRGAVIKTTGMNSLTVDGNFLTAGAGARLAKISDAACKSELTGLEFACGIPGTVGGAVYMNAGAYGNSVSDVCESVTVYDNEQNEIRTIYNEGMQFGYRESAFQNNHGWIVLEAKFKLSAGIQNEIRSEMDSLLAKRKASQPLEYPSAGSVFKRPPGYFAGKLIQDAGLMGYSVGGAQVSEKHAGFIVNKGGATADDVTRLIRHIQATVREKFGVSLEPEIKEIV